MTISVGAKIAKARLHAIGLDASDAALLAACAFSGLTLAAVQFAGGLQNGLGWLEAGLCLASLTFAGLKAQRARHDSRQAQHVSQTMQAREALIASMVDGLVLEHGPDGHVSRAFAGGQNEFGVPQQAWIGAGLFERLHVADRPKFLRSVGETRSGAPCTLVDVRLRLDAQGRVAEGGQTGLHHFDGSNGPMHAPVYAPVGVRITRLEGTGQARYLSYLRNRSQIVALEQEKADALAQVEALDHWRGHLLANVSHELRTPLNAIIGFADILKDGLGDPPGEHKQREFAGIIGDSGRHLLSLVNSILDMSKIEAGRLTLAPEPFALLPVVAECCDMFQIEAAHRGLVLSRDWSETSALTDNDMVADKRALRQIIINLMGNASKFTPNGGSITVSVRRQGNFVRFSVRDSGIGMSSDDLKRLGEPFFQAANTYDRAHEGTGLGLALVRGLVGLHGGSLRIESTQGQGTCVSLLLPWDSASARHCEANIAIVTGPLPRHGYAEEFFPDQYRMRKIA